MNNYTPSAPVNNYTPSAPVNNYAPSAPVNNYGHSHARGYDDHDHGNANNSYTDNGNDDNEAETFPWGYDPYVTLNRNRDSWRVIDDDLYD